MGNCKTFLNKILQLLGVMLLLVSCLGGSKGNEEIKEKSFGLKIQPNSGSSFVTNDLAPGEGLTLSILLTNTAGDPVKGGVVKLEFEGSNEGAIILSSTRTTNQSGVANFDIVAPAEYSKNILLKATASGTSVATYFQVFTQSSVPRKVKIIAPDTWAVGVELGFKVEVHNENSEIVTWYEGDVGICAENSSQNLDDGATPSVNESAQFVLFGEGEIVADSSCTSYYKVIIKDGIGSVRVKKDGTGLVNFALKNNSDGLHLNSTKEDIYFSPDFPTKYVFCEGAAVTKPSEPHGLKVGDFGGSHADDVPKDINICAVDASGSLVTHYTYDAVTADDRKVTVRIPNATSAIWNNGVKDIEVSFVSGRATALINDKLVEEFDLELVDSATTHLDVTDTLDLAFEPGPANEFFLDSTQYDSNKEYIDGNHTTDGPVAIRIEVRDRFNNLATDYIETAAVELSVSEANSNTSISFPSGAATVNFNLGVGSIDLADSEAEMVTLSLTNPINSLLVDSTNFFVEFEPGAPHHFSISDPDGNSDGTVTVDNPVNVCVEAMDQNENRVVTYNQDVSITTTPNTNIQPLSLPSVVDIISGIGCVDLEHDTNEDVTVSLLNPSQVTMDISDTSSIWFKWGVATALNFITPVPNHTEVGNHIVVELNAFDQYNNLVKDYAQSVDIVSSSSDAVLTPATVTFVAGEISTSIYNEVSETVTLSMANPQDLSVNITDTEDVIFDPGTIEKIEILEPALAEYTVPGAASLIAQGQDRFGNEVDTFDGQATIVLSSPSTQADLDNGDGVIVGSYDLVFNNESSKTFAIFDQKAEVVNVTLTGIVNNTNAKILTVNDEDVTFIAGAPDHIEYITPATDLIGGAAIEAGDPIDVSLEVRDIYDNRVTHLDVGAYVDLNYVTSLNPDTAGITVVDAGNNPLVNKVYFTNQGRSDFKLRSTIVETIDISLSDDASHLAGVTVPSRQIEFIPAPAHHYTFIDHTDDISVYDDASLSVEVRDEFDNIIPNLTPSIAQLELEYIGAPIGTFFGTGGTGTANTNVSLSSAGSGSFSVTATIPGSYTVGIVNPDAGTSPILTDMSATTVLNFIPGAVSAVTIDNPDSVADKQVGDDVDVNVFARDQWGNIVTWFSGSVEFRVDGEAYLANLEGDQVKFINFTNGQATVVVNNKKPELVNIDLISLYDAAGGTGVRLNDSFIQISGDPDPNLNSSQNILFNVGDPHHFGIIADEDATVGESPIVEVQMRDEFDNDITNYEFDVLVNLSGSATPTPTTLDIASGAASFAIGNTVSETVTISLAKPAVGFDLSLDSITEAYTENHDIKFKADKPAKIVIVEPANNSIYSVDETVNIRYQVQDQYGNIYAGSNFVMTVDDPGTKGFTIQGGNSVNLPSGDSYADLNHTTPETITVGVKLPLLQDGVAANAANWHNGTIDLTDTVDLVFTGGDPAKIEWEEEGNTVDVNAGDNYTANFKVLDQFGNHLTSYTKASGVEVYSDSASSISGVGVMNITAGNGSLVVSNTESEVVDLKFRSYADIGLYPHINLNSTFTLNFKAGAVDHYFIEREVAFGSVDQATTVTVHARDQFDNIVDSFTGSARIKFSGDGTDDVVISGTVNKEETLNFSAGVATIDIEDQTKEAVLAEIITHAATDSTVLANSQSHTSPANPHQATFIFDYGNPAKIEFDTPVTLNYTAGDSESFTFRVLDQYDNLVENYAQDLQLLTDGGDIDADPATTTELDSRVTFNSGVGTVALQNFKVGNVKLKFGVSFDLQNGPGKLYDMDLTDELDLVYAAAVPSRFVVSTLDAVEAPGPATINLRVTDQYDNTVSDLSESFTVSVNNTGKIDDSGSDAVTKIFNFPASGEAKLSYDLKDNIAEVVTQTFDTFSAGLNSLEFITKAPNETLADLGDISGAATYNVDQEFIAGAPTKLAVILPLPSEVTTANDADVLFEVQDSAGNLISDYEGSFDLTINNNGEFVGEVGQTLSLTISAGKSSVSISDSTPSDVVDLVVSNTQQNGAVFSLDSTPLSPQLIFLQAVPVKIAIKSIAPTVAGSALAEINLEALDVFGNVVENWPGYTGNTASIDIKIFQQDGVSEVDVDGTATLGWEAGGGENTLDFSNGVGVTRIGSSIAVDYIVKIDSASYTGTTPLVGALDLTSEEDLSFVAPVATKIKLETISGTAFSSSDLGMSNVIIDNKAYATGYGGDGIMVKASIVNDAEALVTGDYFNDSLTAVIKEINSDPNLELVPVAFGSDFAGNPLVFSNNIAYLLAYTSVVGSYEIGLTDGPDGNCSILPALGDSDTGTSGCQPAGLPTGLDVSTTLVLDFTPPPVDKWEFVLPGEDHIGDLTGLVEGNTGSGSALSDNINMHFKGWADYGLEAPYNNAGEGTRIKVRALRWDPVASDFVLITNLNLSDAVQVVLENDPSSAIFDSSASFLDNGKVDIVAGIGYTYIYNTEPLHPTPIEEITIGFNNIYYTAAADSTAEASVFFERALPVEIEWSLVAQPLAGSTDNAINFNLQALDKNGAVVPYFDSSAYELSWAKSGRYYTCAVGDCFAPGHAKTDVSCRDQFNAVFTSGTSSPNYQWTLPETNSVELKFLSETNELFYSNTGLTINTSIELDEHPQIPLTNSIQTINVDTGAPHTTAIYSKDFEESSYRVSGDPGYNSMNAPYVTFCSGNGKYAAETAASTPFAKAQDDQEWQSGGKYMIVDQFGNGIRNDIDTCPHCTTLADRGLAYEFELTPTLGKKCNFDSNGVLDTIEGSGTSLSAITYSTTDESFDISNGTSYDLSESITRGEGETIALLLKAKLQGTSSYIQNFCTPHTNVYDTFAYKPGGVSSRDLATKDEVIIEFIGGVPNVSVGAEHDLLAENLDAADPNVLVPNQKYSLMSSNTVDWTQADELWGFSYSGVTPVWDGRSKVLADWFHSIGGDPGGDHDCSDTASTCFYFVASDEGGGLTNLLEASDYSGNDVSISLIIKGAVINVDDEETGRFLDNVNTSVTYTFINEGDTGTTGNLSVALNDLGLDSDGYLSIIANTCSGTSLNSPAGNTCSVTVEFDIGSASTGEYRRNLLVTGADGGIREIEFIATK